MSRTRLIFALVIALLAIGGVMLNQRLQVGRVNDLPGTVQGANPKHIPESQLPKCDYKGTSFVEEPCYVPPGAIYF